MKQPPTTRPICGTEAGYRKHRRTNENWCLPCNEAHNVHRKATYNPDKNRQYKEVYLVKPEAQELRKQYFEKYYEEKRNSPEEVVRRAALAEKRRLAAIEREANRYTKQKAYYEDCAFKSAVTRDQKLDKAVASAFASEQRREMVALTAFRRRVYILRRRNGGDYTDVEHYTREEIFERDNYTCHLCNEKVDLTAPPQSGRPGWETYPHLDHVIPLSKGGRDTPDNVRTAHAKCNMAKGAKLINTPEVAV